MADHLSGERRSWNMSRIRSKHTAPEIAVRRTLYKNGLRYRLHAKDLPGKPDIVIRKHKTAVFINGCFWHQHTGCQRSTSPKTNQDYWLPKLKGNIERQKIALSKLKKDNWNTVTIWECEASQENYIKDKFLEVLFDE